MRADHRDSQVALFIQEAMLQRGKFKIELKQLEEFVDEAGLITKINDRGLFLMIIADLFLKKQFGFSASLGRFTEMLQNKEKPKASRRNRPRGQGQGRRRRHRRIHLAEIDDNQLERLSNQSLQSRKNVQAPRQNVEGQNQEESKSSKDSKDSKSSSKENQKVDDHLDIAQLQRIKEEEMAENALTGMDQNDMANHHGMELDENSSTNSSQSEMVIRNLAEKMQLLTDSSERDRGRGNGTATRRRNNNPRRATTTRKKLIDIIMDENTILEDSRGINISMLQSINQSKTFIDNAETTELYRQFMPRMLNKNSQLFNISFQADNIARLKEFSRRMGLSPQNGDMQMLNTDLSDFNPTQNFSSLPEYTMSQPTYYQQAFNQERHEIHERTEIRGHVSIQSLGKKGRREMSVLFYEMIWREQNGEVCLEQRDVEDFGDILISNA